MKVLFVWHKHFGPTDAFPSRQVRHALVWFKMQMNLSSDSSDSKVSKKTHQTFKSWLVCIEIVVKVASSKDIMQTLVSTLATHQDQFFGSRLPQESQFIRLDEKFSLKRKLLQRSFWKYFRFHLTEFISKRRTETKPELISHARFALTEIILC